MRSTPHIDPRGRRFRSRFLEQLSHIHPAVPFMLWIPITLMLCRLGREVAPLSFVGLFAAGWFVWTLAEYSLHRWVFHWEPANPRLNQLMRPIHKVHHEILEWDRVVAHPMFTIPMAALFFLVFRLALGAPAVYPCYAGFVVGYLTYEAVHLRTHFGRARTRMARALRRRHLQHHHACPARWFGVSTPLWDFVFRTHVPRGVRPAELDRADRAG